MTTIAICKNAYKVCAVLMAVMVTAQMFGANLLHECLDRQEVYGRTTTIYHGAAVEPTIAVNPKNKKQIVAAWQQDRISNAAALEIGAVEDLTSLGGSII